MTLPSSFEQMIESKYLKKEDVIPDKLYTIRAFELVNAAGDNQPPENKWCMYFQEVDKGMLLNSTNIQLMKMALGVAGPQQAVGRQIVLFNDPSVSYGGKLVGGIRLRAPRMRAPQVPVQTRVAQEPAQASYTQSAPAPLHVDKFEDDIPF